MKPMLVSSMLFLMACGGTEYTRRTFPLDVAGQRPVALVTDSGWSVTLNKATAHLASVRFFEGKVLVTRRSPWWRSLLISEAWAHPGHYQAGEALGELLAPLELDLLSPGPVRWGEVDALTGSYGSVQLGFAEGGLELEGTATRAGETVVFAGRVQPEAALEGLPFDHEMTTAAGSVQLRLELQVLLSRVDFGRVGSSAAPIDVTSPAFNGLARGVGDTNGYLLTWTEN